LAEKGKDITDLDEGNAFFFSSFIMPPAIEYNSFTKFFSDRREDDENR
jgi:hypothetical protein